MSVHPALQKPFCKLSEHKGNARLAGCRFRVRDIPFVVIRLMMTFGRIGETTTDGDCV